MLDLLHPHGCADLGRPLYQLTILEMSMCVSPPPVHPTSQGTSAMVAAIFGTLRSPISQPWRLTSSTTKCNTRMGRAAINERHGCGRSSTARSYRLGALVQVLRKGSLHEGSIVYFLARDAAPGATGGREGQGGASS